MEKSAASLLACTRSARKYAERFFFFPFHFTSLLSALLFSAPVSRHYYDIDAVNRGKRARSPPVLCDGNKSRFVSRRKSTAAGATAALGRRYTVVCFAANGFDHAARSSSHEHPSRSARVHAVVVKLFRSPKNRARPMSFSDSGRKHEPVTYNPKVLRADSVRTSDGRGQTKRLDSKRRFDFDSDGFGNRRRTVRV